MSTQPPKQQEPLKDALMQKIEAENVRPRPRLLFQGKEAGVWLAWLLSVVVGALSVAVTLFVVTHRQYELYEATHESFFIFMIAVLPYLWLIIFLLVVFLAVYHLRHTKRGYRYSAAGVIGSSVVASCLGGLALHAFGFGYVIDDSLGKNMDMYISQTKLEQQLWQVPSEGRLVGWSTDDSSATATKVLFTDIDGVKWHVSIAELPKRDRLHLQSKKTVRLLGQVTDSDKAQFHVCGVFPWMIKKGVTKSDMVAAREEFIKNAYGHMVQREENEVSSAQHPKICANLAMMRRMQHK